ncbi:DUF2484 family protein [Octadecabacter ascidiaceicola]|uniref:DUF2484 family protein n=1 Tax=Octadecabacter ascidiaceicola TaxID=1655543 RepID=A0A238K4Z0_9RHOB|nr:DUF2484 family protein [Octadecabacter ascidiaceicola]SMX37929.1 hypothetical protein OCA8868_01614 [Octadecabacter ascidiaceicola]
MMAVGLGFAWLVAANVLAMLPSRDNLWTRAYVLIAIGIPLLGYITYINGPLWGMAFLVAGCSVLRWPVIYLGRWIRRVMAKTES